MNICNYACDADSCTTTDGKNRDDFYIVINPTTGSPALVLAIDATTVAVFQ